MRLDLNPNISFFQIPEHTDEWYKAREEGIGASECATLFDGVDKYSCPAAMFHDKVGDYPRARFDNEATFHGRHLEDYVATMWQYWDGKSYIENYNSKTIVRKCTKVKAIIKNKKWPHLFVSLDRYMVPGSLSLISGLPMEDGGVLEIKTIEGWESSDWEAGIPPKYVIQIQQQLLVTGLDYAEMAVFRNGRHLSVLPFETNVDIQNAIVRLSTDFWVNRVLPAKAAFKKAVRGGKMDDARAVIDSFEPEPDSSEAYKMFLKAKFPQNEADEVIKYTDEYLALAASHKAYSQLTKLFQQKADYCYNNLLNECLKNNIKTIVLPKGKITLTTNNIIRNSYPDIQNLKPYYGQ